MFKKVQVVFIELAGRRRTHPAVCSSDSSWSPRPMSSRRRHLWQGFLPWAPVSAKKRGVVQINALSQGIVSNAVYGSRVFPSVLFVFILPTVVTSAFLAGVFNRYNVAHAFPVQSICTMASLALGTSLHVQGSQGETCASMLNFLGTWTIN